MPGRGSGRGGRRGNSLTPANAKTSRKSSTPSTYSTNIPAGSSDKQAHPSTPDTPPDQYPCGTCNVNIGDEDALECEICSVWTHGGQRCSGLPHEVFRNVVDYSALGVSYVCTSCRLNKNSKDNSSGYNQLFESVRGLNQAVSDLALEIKQIKSLSTGSAQSHPSLTMHNSFPQVDNPHFRKILQEELIEIRQREKRADYIIIRGLGSDINQIQGKFTDVTNFLFKCDKSISLQDITPIKQDLVRARVTDQQVRRELLNYSKNLKGSIHDGVFISRDLTYKQRMAIKQRASSQVQNRPDGPSDPTGIPQAAPAIDSSDFPSLPQAQAVTPVTRDNPPPSNPKN